MSKKTAILLSLIILKFLIQYALINPDYDLHRDEFLHLDQANHLAWGYLSVPPVTSWISVCIKGLGNSIFWIRFFPTLFGAITSFIVWKTIEELNGNLFALVLGTSCVTFSVLFRLNALYQPNSLDVLCWTAVSFFLIRYLNSASNKWLIWIAVTFALGFLNKYNIVFLLMGVLPALLFTAERKIFLDKNLYIAAMFSVFLVLPNLAWQYQNHFPVFHHLAELSATQLIHVKRLDFVHAQLLFFPGTFIVIILALYALVSYEPFKIYRLFFWSFWFTLGIFIFLRAKDYYAIGIYPIFFAFGAVYISTLLENKNSKILKPVCIALSVLFFIPVYQIAYPDKPPEYLVKHPEKYRKFGMLRWEDGKEHPLPQDFADMLGWRELARKVDSTYKMVPNPAHTLILCDNYGQAGAINYYSKLGIRAVSFNADYVNWFNLTKNYDNLIRVKNYVEIESEWKKTAPLFRKSIISASVTNKYAREYGTTVFCFIQANVNINERIRKEVQEEQLTLGGLNQ